MEMAEEEKAPEPPTAARPASPGDGPPAAGSPEPAAEGETKPKSRRGSKEIEARKEGGPAEPPKRKGSKDAGEAKRKQSRKPSKGADEDDDDENEEEPKIIYPIDPKIQETLRTAWTLFVKKNQKKKTEISEAQVPILIHITTFREAREKVN